MGKLTQLAVVALATLSFASFAQEAEPEFEDGYISDELFIYMHSGAGNNYRITGSINAGTQVKLTGEARNGYTQIIDDKGREAWVEDKFVSTKPGLRYVVAELNGQLATTGEKESSLQSQINESTERLNAAENQTAELTNKITNLESQLASAQSKLNTQDMDVKKEWFFNGAIVLGIGLILGLILPRISTRRKSSMDSWS
ncbi:TIGR04211 family SH3 domain-containing protein [Thalassotalea sp. M1531]|uniref:TIGR04211 family SH3 domain-containing protein n=1 Tax=Thalassotalea algicola TaxID=2716224 RepID=A0A7Y0LFI8_9GAMM|nr:TIGR04211 family SH3 domain-containing protein [Thalassotalea algicola]NMP32245.1 TIGR04211 family SH3 domain-containing protein [Thalassotalea algicola]